MSSDIAYFSVDSEITFPEYTALLYEHAFLELENQAEHLNEGGVIEAVEAMKEKSKVLVTTKNGADADVAYFFASRALRLAAAWYHSNKAKSDAGMKARARDMFSSALTYVEKLKNSAYLQNIYDKLMSSVKSSLPERERLKKLQMENVEDDASAIADRNAKELESALEKGGGGTAASAAAMLPSADELGIPSDEMEGEGGEYHHHLQADGEEEYGTGEQGVDSEQDALRKREERRQELLRAEQEALRNQSTSANGGFDFNSLVAGGATTTTASSTLPTFSAEIPPPPPSMPPPDSSVLGTASSSATSSGSSDALQQLRNQFSDAISIVNETKPTVEPKPMPSPPPQQQPTTTTTFQNTMKPVFESNNFQPAEPQQLQQQEEPPITNINQMPAPTSIPKTNNTALPSKALDEAREFLKSNPAPDPLPQHLQPKKSVSWGENKVTPIPPRPAQQQQKQLPSRVVSTSIRPSTQKPQQLLPQKRMFQFGRGAIWGYPRVAAASHLRRRGLVNLGNSCYLNSVVQCLCCTPLREAVMRENTSRLACALNFVFKSLRVAPDSAAARTPVGPSAVKSAVASRFSQFGTMQQQDANEFFVNMLDQLCEETHKKGPRPSTQDIETRRQSDTKIAKEFFDRHMCVNNSQLGALFSFQTRQMNMCNTCGESARNFDVMMTLDLPIPLGAPPGSVATLHDCLCMYTKPDVTPPGRDAFYKCENCKTVRGSTHQTSIFSCPKILVITLKRFRQVGSGNFSDKINVPVVYPQELDLSSFMLAEAKANHAEKRESTRFRLVGHVSHQGNTHGGHYTATSCDYNNDRQWWFSSDERLNEVGGNQADFAYAYMLFYVRQDL